MSRVKLSDIATVTAGNVAPKAKDFTPDGVPFVRAGSLSGLLETGDFSQLETINTAAASKLRLKLFPAGTVVFAKSGMSCLKGYVYTLPRECYVVSHLACVTPNEGYSRYLQHYFRYWKPNRLIENPSFPSIKLSKISDIELNLPDSVRAKEIVDNLEAVLGLIDAEQLQARKLDELVKSRFVEMFGTLQANEFNWPVTSLVEVAEKINDGEHGKVIRANEGPLFLSARNVGDGYLKYDGCAHVTEEEFLRITKRFNPQPGDVVLTCAGTIGRSAIVGDTPFVSDRDVALIKPRRGVITSQYLQGYFCSDDAKRQMGVMTHSATISHLYIGKIKSMQILVPPLALQQEFATFVQQVDKLKFETQQAIEKLQMLYDSLAQEYFGS